ncbi:MAG: hypothetical protein V4574_06450 [Pseudomonadota bacterium]
MVFFSILLFGAAFAASIWAMIATIRPRFGRILFLLQYGPLTASALPPAPRVTLRGRPVPMRMTVPARLRAAA